MLASDRMLVTDDATIALDGALAGEPGIVVIAGTGSIAFGRNAQGRTARAGGWGYLFGDEGGGFWIVREAMRAALRWEEGWGSPTALRAMFLDATGTRNMNDLMHRCYTPEFPRQRVAGLALRVNYAAEKGDPTAREILAEAARELARLVHAVRSQLFEAGAISAHVPTWGEFSTAGCFWPIFGTIGTQTRLSSLRSLSESGSWRPVWRLIARWDHFLMESVSPF